MLPYMSLFVHDLLSVHQLYTPLVHPLYVAVDLYYLIYLAYPYFPSFLLLVSTYFIIFFSITLLFLVPFFSIKFGNEIDLLFKYTLVCFWKIHLKRKNINYRQYFIL